ncbi:MAG: type VI secretion system tip protein VgrG, partial [Bacteroidota bacterium]
EIQAGYHREEDTIFKGIIVKNKVRSYQNKPAVLRISCKDEAVKLSIGRSSRYFYEVTDSEALEELIEAAGLSAEIETTATQHQELVQYNTTNWDFLVTRAEVNNKLVYTEDGTLRIATPQLDQDAVLQLRYGGNVLDFELELEARQQFEGVNGYAWSAADQALVEVEANPPTGSFPGNLSRDELAKVIGLAQLELRHAGQIKDTELQSWVDAQWLKSQLSKVRGRIRIQGIGTAKPGLMLEMNGAGNRFNGKAFISGVQHDINTQNWETNIEVGLSPYWFSQAHEDISVQAAHGMIPSVNGLQIGLVTALEGDPEGEDRIQIRIPMIDPQEEGIWARVATFDAGENRGAFFRPEIGDEVVLGFLDNDPRNCIVLGGLHSSAKPAPIGATDDNHEKGFVSRSELKVLFNDDLNTIQIETPKGNLILLSEEDGGILLEDENGNKVQTSSDGILIESAKDVVIKASGDLTMEGTNIEIKANANFKAEGSAGAELSASGSTVVKGAVVQIN